MRLPSAGLADSTNIILVHTLARVDLKDARLDCGGVEVGGSAWSGGGALSPLWDLARPKEDKERGSVEDASQSMGVDRSASNSAPSTWLLGTADSSGIDLQLIGRDGVALTVDEDSAKVRLALGLS